MEGNRLEGVRGGGADLLRPGLAVTVVAEQPPLRRARGCPRRANAGAGAGGRRFAGSGELVVRDNVFLESGNTLAQALLHEVAIDWRGEVGVRGNTVRHEGGGGGGAGVLVVTDTLPEDLVVKLSRVPFLASDPPPKVDVPGRAVAPATRRPR